MDDYNSKLPPINLNYKSFLGNKAPLPIYGCKIIPEFKGRYTKSRSSRSSSRGSKSPNETHFQQENSNIQIIKI